MISKKIKDSLTRYAEQGVPTGGFLEACLSNDLYGAYAIADARNLKALPYIIRHIYNTLPYKCCGSAERYSKWIERGGIQGRSDD